MVQATLNNYVGNIKTSGSRCYWSPQGQWRRAHGDGKGTTKGRFCIQTLYGNDKLYHVTVRSGISTVLGPFTMPGSEEPSSEAVASEINERVKKRKAEDGGSEDAKL